MSGYTYSGWPMWTDDGILGHGAHGVVHLAKREEFGRTFYSAIKVIQIPSDKGEVNELESSGMNEDSMEHYFYRMVEDLIDEVDTMESLKSAPNIVHRDIKPANIFVSEFGDFKLGDFGISRHLEKTNTGLSQKGTGAYMAPEVYHGDVYNHTVDIYSLGIVLYRILNNGRLPFMPPYPQPIQPGDMEEANLHRMSGEPLPPLHCKNQTLADCEYPLRRGANL